MDKLAILKSLAPGFLPLLVFIVADALWGTKIGLIIAVSLGILELIYSYLKEKILDKFILLDVGLIVVLGMVSILLENDLFFKLKPALIGGIFCAILGVSVYSPVNVMMLMSRRYMKNLKVSEAQVEQMNRGLRVLFYIFLAHTGLVVYAAFFMSRQAWGFISGGLFYILFGAYLVVELVRRRIRQKRMLDKYRDDEWFDIVDEEGRVTGSAPRTLCHSGPGLLHPVVHLHLIDSKNRVFLQKRAATKQIQPGKWDTAVGGHVMSGETIEKALVREAEEELGITPPEVRMLGRYVWRSDIESELVFMFLCRWDKAVRINTEEIDDGKFMKMKKIKDMMGKELLTPNFEYEFDILQKVIG